MKRLELDLLLSLYVYFSAAYTITVARDNVYYKCKDFESSSGASHFNFICDAGKMIIVKSAIVGATDRFNPPDQCPITNNTCLKEITIAADLCTWRNECVISQNVQLTDQLQLPCSQNGNTVANFININYTCIVSGPTNYGDICHFNEVLYSNSAVYISSYPNFPGAMSNYSHQCSCLLTSSTSSANVSIRALLVKLTSVATCSERLSIIDSEGVNKLEFCSPCNNVKNVTAVPLASHPVEILFQRYSDVTPYNGKFILEITVPSSETGSIGMIKCGLHSSTISSLTNITKASPSYFSTTTTSAILSQPNSFSSTNDQNTSSRTTVSSSNVSTSAGQSILSSTKPASETQDTALSSSVATLASADRPTLASQTDSDKKSLSTGGIIGIVLGSVGLIVIAIIILLCLLRKQKRHHNPSKGNTNFISQQSVTVIQNMQTTNNIQSHEATSSELHTFQSAAHFSDEPQTTGYENNCQTKDNSMSIYEEGAPVSDAKYGPGMIPANEQTRLDDNTGDGDITLVENQLYGENEKPMTDVVTSSDYDVVRPVVQYGRTDESAGVDRGYGQMKNSSADHSYYNVPAHTGSGTTIQSPTEVNTETETNSVSDEIETTNPMYKADSDVVLIDNTLYGSMLTF